VLIKDDVEYEDTQSQMGASRAKIGVGTLKSLASDTKMTT